MAGNLALLVDAGHLLTDVGGLGLVPLALRFAVRPASPARTYGYYRPEKLAVLTNAVVLVLISVYVLYEAYQRSKTLLAETCSTDRGLRRRLIGANSPPPGGFTGFSAVRGTRHRLRACLQA